MSYIVTSPLVIVRNPEQSNRDEYLYEGAPLPSFVTGDPLTTLVADGHVAAVEVPEVVEVEPVDPKKPASKS